jgi:hypothetical protein
MPLGRERTPEEQAEWDSLPPVPPEAYEPYDDDGEDDFMEIFLANLNENALASEGE